MGPSSGRWVAQERNGCSTGKRETDKRLNPSHEIAVEIGGMPILFRTRDSSFRQLLENRYTGFMSSLPNPKFEFEVELVTPSSEMESEEDARVEMQDGLWHLRRGDFRAQWDPRAGRGPDPANRGRAQGRRRGGRQWQ